ncbi:hypothetical protein B0T24DRAFT_724253 [Lasiosphaeria ovina]|uniref:Heterokaryon incompatibility domain-containing protein n=1 Tax=Lasiosphaeria ovina TaxID=92902 RepID=A0AAE0JTV4_9PEZI|nr:hypothetical protein B0T24DRAFT_724253 [Lasiosphaeria ovina]
MDIGPGNYQTLPLDTLEQVRGLWQFRVARHEAEKWAFRDIKFLVFDQADSQSEGELSSNKINGGLDVNRNGGPEELGGKSDCRICSGLPEFPHDQETRTFRLFSPAKAHPSLLADRVMSVDVCRHYVAVSYCWPELVKDECGNIVRAAGTYQVRDLDGRTRNNRAPDDVLDRAVDFANNWGLRMIWIDQECLPQPAEDSPQHDKDYQQLGVQAMDIVYNRALVTAALHAGEFTSQAQLDAVQELISFDGIMDKFPGKLRVNISPRALDYVLEFLDTVARDRWYTRAWIAQEALSAGDRLVLVFRRRISSISGMARYRFTDKYHDPPPKHSLDSRASSRPAEIVCIPMTSFQQLVRAARFFVHRRRQALSHPLISRRAPSPLSIVSAAEQLHPQPQESHGEIVEIFGGQSYGQRRWVDAAGALTLLKDRGCRDWQDLIAIVANMCNYEIRLNTDAVARNCQSLRVGLLALALLNGDLSLLVPEAYSLPGGNPVSEQGLLAPFDSDFKNISHFSVQRRGLAMPRVHKHVFNNLDAPGLHLPAYIWTVTDQISLAPMKKKWAETWHRLKRFRTIVQRLEGETAEAFSFRRATASKYFATATTAQRARDEIIASGCIAPGSAIWGGLDPAGVDCRLVLEARRVEADPGLQELLAEILFDILRHLASLTDPRASGVANSLWQSVRADLAHKERLDIPDEVGDALFAHVDVVSTPWKTLQLDRGRGGEYAQLWFVDRIMRHGALRVGRYNRVPLWQALDGGTLLLVPPELRGELLREERRDEKGTGEKTTGEKAARREDPREKAEEEPPAATAASVANPTLQRVPAPAVLPLGDGDDSATRPPYKIPADINTPEPSNGIGELHSTLLGRQFSLQFQTTWLSSTVTGTRTAAGEHVDVSAGMLAHLKDIEARGSWTAATDARRARDLVAVFDVDGPCTVATPFDHDWEWLPRPELRSMSACWVVERVVVPVDADRYGVVFGAVSRGDRDGDVREAQAVGESAGQPSLNAGTAAGIVGGGSEIIASVEDCIVVEKAPAFRVVGKVRGSWQLMDLPLQEYVFS